MARERGSVRYHRGGWELRVQVDGRKVTRRHAGPDTRAGRQAAEKALDQLVDELLAPEALSVAELLDRYILAEGHRWKPSTRQKAPGLARSVAATSLGARAVGDLRPRDIKAAWAEVRALGRAPGTVRRYHSLISGALGYAVDEEIIVTNPAYGIRLGGTAKTRVEDLPRMAEVYPAAARIEHDRLRSVVLVALGTGARRGELAALRWVDVDLDAATVRITAAISGGERATTKYGPGRTITIDAATVTVLRSWRTVAARHALTLGHRLGPQSPIWAADTDPTAPWAPSAISNCWVVWRGRVGLNLRFHDLRHVNATALLLAGVPVSIVSYRLGHASAKMTWDVYGHVVEGDDAAAAAVMDTIITGTGTDGR